MTERTVWKFELASVPFTLPRGRIVHVGDDPAGSWSAWIEVDPQTVDEDRIGASVIGTGHPIPNRGVHAGSWVSGPFVWHLYVEDVS